MSRNVSRRDFVIGASIAASCRLTAVIAGNSARFTYRNPIGRLRVRDCQIVREQGLYYMTGTFPPFWPPAPSHGVSITYSRDLLHWSKPQLVLRPNRSRWYQQLFWAAEIFPYGGKFYLTFNCPRNGAAPLSESSPLAVGLAVADSIMGPYTVITEDEPLTAGNDGTLFLDVDGKVYVYSASRAGDRLAFPGGAAEGIACSEVALSKGQTIGNPIACVPTGSPDEWDGGKKVGIEGPSVFRRNGVYYLMYSSWRHGYEVGYATAQSARGPWTKHTGNPIYGAQDPEWCKEFNSICTQAADVPFGQVGHGSPFFGPDRRLWFCCHGIELKGKGRDTEPHLVITPMEFSADGELSMKLTWTRQTVAIPGPVADAAWRQAGSPASCR